mmetsp:Transcript_21153/g.43001  ORF Transcript_21153/g.43001 Transcript_21153/m.43001 type:complete len:374 (-) Transcript_21153:2775-3896(-)
MMVGIQALLLMSPALLAQSYSVLPQIFGLGRSLSPRQSPSISLNNGKKGGLPFLSVVALGSVSSDNLDDDRNISTSLHSDDLAITGQMERKSFIRGSIISLSAIAGLRPAWGTSVDPKTGIRLPDPGEIETSIPTDWSQEENPISSSGTGTGGKSNSNTQFGRLDNTPDSIFYQDPRFVEHVDENAVKLITEYISNTAIQPGRDTAVLDLCSSWTSHIERSVADKMTRIAGLGMNAKELESNPILTDWIVQDLNEKPELTKYETESFDVVVCQVSIDYLTKPLQVLKDVGRILKPGGQVHIIFSNRLFLTKAVGLWTGGDDIDHAYYVGSYLHFCEGGFEGIKAKDLSTRKGGKDKRIVGDPVFVVTATKATA